MRIGSSKQKIANLKQLVEQQTDEILRLKETQKLFHTVFDMIAGNHWWKDIHGVYQDCNMAMVKDLGLNCKEDIVGKTDFDLPWSVNAEALIKNACLSEKRAYQLNK